MCNLLFRDMHGNHPLSPLRTYKNTNVGLKISFYVDNLNVILTLKILINLLIVLIPFHIAT